MKVPAVHAVQFVHGDEPLALQVHAFPGLPLPSRQLLPAGPPVAVQPTTVRHCSEGWSQ